MERPQDPVDVRITSLFLQNLFNLKTYTGRLCNGRITYVQIAKCLLI